MDIDNSQSDGALKPLEIYLVGGAVRDKLLNLEVQDRDWVVVGATREDMLARGFIPVSGAFPVFLHPRTGEEYALARREVKTGRGYHGFSVETGPQVSLQDDLARRDLTINAMAEDTQGNIIDPFAGQDDLANGLLRHVTPAFVEDPVRLLRIARFAARFGHWGFGVAHGTHGLMKKMVAAGELRTLPGTRVWKEMRKALMEKQPWRFFQVLHSCGALAQLFPILDETFAGTGAHGAERDSVPVGVLKRAANADLDLSERFVCIMQFAVGSHCSADELATWLGVEKQARILLDDWLQAREQLLRLPEGGAADYLQYLRQHRNRLSSLNRLLPTCLPELGEILMPRLEAAARAMASVKVGQLQAEGLQGKALGDELVRRQCKAIEKQLGEMGGS